MNTYRPKSYSQQVRELAERTYKTYKLTGVKFEFFSVLSTSVNPTESC